MAKCKRASRTSVSAQRPAIPTLEGCFAGGFSVYAFLYYIENVKGGSSIRSTLFRVSESAWLGIS